MQYKQMPLTKAEEDFFASLIRAKKVRRKQFLDQPGFVSMYRNYVVKSALRTYIIGDNGLEHTIALAIEGGFIGDHGSFLSQEPATFIVEGISESTKEEDIKGKLLETLEIVKPYLLKKVINFSDLEEMSDIIPVE